MTILLNKANKRSEEYKLRSQQNEFNIQYAENIRKQYDEIRLIRHDIKQNYAVLEGLLNEGKTQSALEYIQKQTDILAKNTVSVKLGNDRINSLIGSKLSFAKSSGVEVICSSNGNLSGIDDADLCTLLGNILDNAVEGCRNSSSDHKFIEIKLVGDEDKISVAVSNSAAPNSIENINKLKTTKENAEIHGFGIKSIRKIAEKYGGSASYEQVGDVITCHVLLYK